MADAPRSSADGNGGAGGSGGGKRRSPSPPLSFGCSVKRSQVEVTAKGDAETEKPEEEAPVSVAVQEDAGTASRRAVAEGKRSAHMNVQKMLPPAATGLQATEPQSAVWARLLSENKLIPEVLIFTSEFSVGGSETCNICLKDHGASCVLCKLCLVEQSSECQLQVTCRKGLVELNGSKIGKDGIAFLKGGDEVAFCKHAFIFQPCNTVPVSASATLPPSGSQIFKDGLKQGILDPYIIEFTLEDFPYHLSDNTKRVLVSTAYVHIGKTHIKYLSAILSLNQRILLSGPSGSEIYQETLMMALAKSFGSKFLIVDSLMLPVNELCLDSSGDQDVVSLGIDELIEVISDESTSSSLIVLVKDAEKALTRRTESHALLKKELPPGVLIIGSHTERDSLKDVGSSESSMMYLHSLFPNKISIELPKNKAELSELKKTI